MFFIFQIPLRASCHYGKHPHKIASNKQFNLFLKGLDYSKVKDNTLCGGNLPSSDWKMLYTTNLVVYVFHNMRRVLGGKATKKMRRGGGAKCETGKRESVNTFIDNEAEVCPPIYKRGFGVLHIVTYRNIPFNTLHTVFYSSPVLIARSRRERNFKILI